jgi:hypothetical protein
MVTGRWPLAQTVQTRAMVLTPGYWVSDSL